MVHMASLCHEDLHRYNLLFWRVRGRWRPLRSDVQHSALQYPLQWVEHALKRGLRTARRKGHAMSFIGTYEERAFPASCNATVDTVAEGRRKHHVRGIRRVD